jgi:hypothetical protein
MVVRLWPWILIAYLAWVFAPWFVGAAFNDLMLRLGRHASAARADPRYQLRVRHPDGDRKEGSRVVLALVTWLTGAPMCILVGACAGPVCAQSQGPVGVLIRGDIEAVGRR